MSAQVDLNTIPISPEGKEPASAIDNAKANGIDRTVFDDKENFTLKHPLMHHWTLWFTKPASGKVRTYSPSGARQHLQHILTLAVGRQLE